ncbi:hypothetical protein COCCU_09175 [Corynebacterium occultum]|uniref:DUF2567 domain-containing protein n=1 Tax=Corynebacterium occultum TaxID=2675219 RepID=A0A6B8VXF9_9CORY|nr:hypothetical protein [Corynebacterium occultum]QGU07759.1 hypothetical protein COCCU_09175 [Corynebacterium occultum]
MTGATETAITPPVNRGPLTRAAGSLAGFLALSLVVYAGVGALWAMLRPTYDATVTDSGDVYLTPAFNVEFTSFISFAVATGLLGALLALVMFVVSDGTRGLGTLFWVTLCAFLGAVVFLVVGDQVSLLLHPVPEQDALEVGETFRLLPGMNPGTAFIAAPFMASLAYWCAVLVSPEIN